jgi:hypothetical protein
MPVILADWEDCSSRPPQASLKDSHLQSRINNQSRIGWICGSSSGAPALQIQSPEFKPQSHLKKKIISLNSCKLSIRKDLSIGTTLETKYFFFKEMPSWFLKSQ